MLRGGQVDDVEDHQVLGPCPKSELGRVGPKKCGTGIYYANHTIC